MELRRCWKFSNTRFDLEAFSSLPEFESAVQEEDAKDFVPPGKLAHSYSLRGRNYEIWAASLADPQVQLLLNRFQIMVSFYIEAGTPLSTDDPEWTLERWMVYFVYGSLYLVYDGERELTELDMRRSNRLPPQPRSIRLSDTLLPTDGGSTREIAQKNLLPKRGPFLRPN